MLSIEKGICVFEDLRSRASVPRATVKATSVHWGWASVDCRWRRSRSAHLTSHVRRDVGTLLSRSSVEVETVHVEVVRVRHIGS